MEPRFFFSTDGRKTHGPVTLAALRQLFADGALTAASFLCPEGSAQWQPLNPEFFSSLAPATTASRRRSAAASAKSDELQTELSFAAAPTPPPPEMAPAATDVPERVEEIVHPEEIHEPPAVTAEPEPAPEIPTPAPEESVAPSVTESPAEVAIETAPPPAEVPPSRPAPMPPPAKPLRLTEFPAGGRPGVPVAAMISGPQPAAVEEMPVQQRKARSPVYGLLAGLVLLLAAGGIAAYFGWSYLQREMAVRKNETVADEQARIEAAHNKLRASVAAAAQEQLKTKGHYEGTADDAAKKLQTLKDQLGNGSSDLSRVSRDLLVVASKLLEKTKACEAAAKSCDFDPTTITGSGDVANREQAIGQLHAAQQDVVAFLQNINGYCQAELSKDHFDEATMSTAIAGFRHSGHIDLLIELWQQQAKLSSDHIARFAFLEKSWRSWKITDGKLVFQNTADVTTYNGLVHVLQDDVATIGDTQKQIFADQPEPTVQPATPGQPATTDQPALRSEQ